MSETRLNEDACGVVKLALEDALQLGYNYIQPEHLLLAMTRQEDSIAVRALARLGIEPKALRKAVLDVLRSGPKCEHCGW